MSGRPAAWPGRSAPRQEGAPGTRKYWTQVPNLLDDSELDPYARVVYLHYKRLAGARAGCDESVRETARRCRVSVGAVVRARQQLVAQGWLALEPSGGGGRAAPRRVRLVDRWEENAARYGSAAGRPGTEMGMGTDERAGACSPGEQAVPPGEQAAWPGEHAVPPGTHAASAPSFGKNEDEKEKEEGVGVGERERAECTADALWARVLTAVGRDHPHLVELYLRPTRVRAVTAEAVWVEVENPFHLPWLHKRLTPEVEAVLRELPGAPPGVVWQEAATRSRPPGPPPRPLARS